MITVTRTELVDRVVGGEGGVELEEGRTSDVVDRVVGGGCRVGRGADK